MTPVIITSNPQILAPVKTKFLDFSHFCEEAKVTGIPIINITDNMIKVSTSS